MTDAENKLLLEVSLSEREIEEIEWLGDKGWLLGIVAPRFQRAVESLIPEFYEQEDNDSLWHWWRRIWEALGEIKEASGEIFWKELEDGKTTLTHETAVKIWKATKKYLLEILENWKRWNELPSWWSVLQKIYDPPIHEIAQIVSWSKD